NWISQHCRRSTDYSFSRLVIDAGNETARNGNFRTRKVNLAERVMAFKVQVGPPQIAIHQGQTVLVTDPDGTITWPSEKGLYFLDTRIISNWAIYANGESWQLLNGGPISYYAARIYLTNKSILTEDGPIPSRTLGPTISRSPTGRLPEHPHISKKNLQPG